MKYTFKRLFDEYSVFQLIKLSMDYLYTKLFFPKCRLIRRPFVIRGKKFIDLGRNLTTGVGCRLDAFPLSREIRLTIGNNVQMNDYVHIGAISCVKIGNDVLIASKVFITDHNHGQYSGDDQDRPDSLPIERKLFSKPVVIEDKVWIGEFVSILPGVTIGQGSIIGTMSVVTKDIPPYSIAVGSPARVIKTFNFTTNKWDSV